MQTGPAHFSSPSTSWRVNELHKHDMYYKCTLAALNLPTIACMPTGPPSCLLGASTPSWSSAGRVTHARQHSKRCLRTQCTHFTRDSTRFSFISVWCGSGARTPPGASAASRSISDRAVRASDAYSVRNELSQGALWTTRGAHSIFFRARSSHCRELGRRQTYFNVFIQSLDIR